MEKQYVTHLTKAAAENASPGPAKYGVVKEFAGRTAPIKMRGRTELSKEVLKPPYYKLKSTLGDVPKISIGPRCDTSLRFVPPGPSYVPPAFGSGARKVSMSPAPAYRIVLKNGTTVKRKDKNETPGPGPGRYLIREKTFDGDGKKGIKITGAHNFALGGPYSPGPAAYKPNLNGVYPQAPKISFHIRPETKLPPISTEYRNIGSTLGGLKFTIKRRQDDPIYLV